MTPDTAGPGGLRTGRAPTELANPIEPVELLTVAEVSTILRVSTMTIYRLAEAGRLRTLRVGRSLRIPRSSLDAFLREAGTSPS
ncbi:MAG TPA: helix-turn-helix domain-containing protein [Pseudonocardia sp.]|jgi:excisionase family DNA binding protein